MSQPPAYAPAYDFEDYQTASPTDPLPGDKVDIEFAAVALSIAGIRTNLALIQRDDGALANAVVTPDSFSTASLALMGGSWTPKGAWVTAAAYVVGDVVSESSITYVCAVAHTSGTFATDLAAAKWVSIGGDAGGVTFDNSASGLTATTVQAAIDEIQGDASKIDYDNSTSGLVATNVKTALDEIDAKADANTTSIAALASGIDWKDRAVVATTGNITLSGEQTIDGVLTSVSRVLVKDQSDATENGVYVSGAGAWVRATDMDAWDEFPGAMVVLEQGSTQADTMWLCTSNSGGTLGSTNVVFSQQGIGDINAAGDGLVKAGATISIAEDGVTPAKISGSINAQTGTTYTLALGDAFKTVTMDNASANTLTIPTDASVAFSVGDRTDVISKGAGVTTVTGDTGVTVNGVSGGSATINARYSGISALKVATNEWVIFGNHGTVS